MSTASGKHTALAGHERRGTLLRPPLMTIDQIALTSWLDNRLPEMLWGALIQEHLGRDNGLDAFRLVAHAVDESTEAGMDADATLSGIASMPHSLRNTVLQRLCEREAARKALRPLLSFPELPARDDWAAIIREDPEASDWHRLARAVALVTDHQSQEATDLRWARVLTVAATGRVHLPATEPAMADEILRYPNVEDQRKVRPLIRAMEGAFDALKRDTQLGKEPSHWPRQFWDRCLAETTCQPAALPTPTQAVVGTTVERVRAVSVALVEHEWRTRSTTAVDVRHEGTFGLASYSLAILDELLRVGNSGGILGRSGLRTLLEVLVTLAYLALKDDSALWQGYRSYGAGQAKLAFLKLDKLGRIVPADLPSHVDVRLLEALANEDKWLEFVDVNLGNWDASNLRAMSEEVGRKAEYDRFYGWTSAFAHGNWAAVRLVAYDICANPLHRWHRVLRPAAAPLGDVIPDASAIVDATLGLLDRLYPGFTQRTRV